MSATLIWIMCVVIVVTLAAWLVAIVMASRRPPFKNPDEPTVAVRKRNSPTDL